MFSRDMMTCQDHGPLAHRKDKGPHYTREPTRQHNVDNLPCGAFGIFSINLVLVVGFMGCRLTHSPPPTCGFGAPTDYTELSWITHVMF